MKALTSSTAQVSVRGLRCEARPAGVFMHFSQLISAGPAVSFEVQTSPEGLMSQGDVKSLPGWKEIAARVAAENDPERVVQLAQKLITALDRRTNDLLAKVPSESKRREQGAA